MEASRLELTQEKQQKKRELPIETAELPKSFFRYTLKYMGFLAGAGGEESTYTGEWRGAGSISGSERFLEEEHGSFL